MTRAFISNNNGPITMVQHRDHVLPKDISNHHPNSINKTMISIKGIFMMDMTKAMCRITMAVEVMGT